MDSHDQCAYLCIEWSGFKPSPWTLCFVLGQDTLLLQCLSLNAGGNPVMDYYSIQGGVEIHLVSSHFLLQKQDKLQPDGPLLRREFHGWTKQCFYMYLSFLDEGSMVD